MPCLKMVRELEDLRAALHEYAAAAAADVSRCATGAVRPGGAGEGLALAERCDRLLLLYQPVACDFRAVAAARRAAEGLARVEEAAAEVALGAGALAALPDPVRDQLDRLSAAVADLVRGAGAAGEAARLAGALRDWVGAAVARQPVPALALYTSVLALERAAGLAP